MNIPVTLFRSLKHAALFASAVIAFFLATTYPFKWSSFENDARVYPNRIEFGGSGIAYVRGPMEWLKEAKRTERLTIAVTARTGASPQWGRSKIVSVGLHASAEDFGLGQRGNNLRVLVRDSWSANDRLDVVVPEVFATSEPQNIVVTFAGRAMTISVNGTTRVSQDLDAFLPRYWDSRAGIALGNTPNGTRAWLGTVFAARVGHDGQMLDLMSPGVLSAPTQFSSTNPIVLYGSDWVDIVLNFVAFLIVGGLTFVCLRRPSVLTVAFLWLPIPVIAELLQVFLWERHPTVADVLLNAGGAIAGAWAFRIAHARGLVAALLAALQSFGVYRPARATRT